MPEDKSEASPQSNSARNPIVDLYTGFEDATYFKSPLVSESFKPPYNPDDLWQKTGSYSIYEEMSIDDQVSVCLRLKKDLILGDGGTFIPGEDGQDEIIKDLNIAFSEDYEGDFDNSLEEILTGYEFGFSLTEKVFKLRENGMLGLKHLRTRHPNSWRLHQDVRGNITKYEQVTVEGDIDVNAKALIHYINDPKFQNPYGNSDLRTAYNAWFTKRQVIKYFAIFLEKAASPIPVGRFNKNAPQAAIDKLLEALKRFQTKTALVVPKEIEVDFLEAKNTGEAYTKALHFFNMVIGRALFIPDLLGFTGGETGGGSLALGKEQMGIFFKHIVRRRRALELIINRELVKPIVMYNHGVVENPPKFKFNPINDMDAVELAKTWLEAVKSKVYKPSEEEINHFRKLTKFPEGDVEFQEPAPMLMPGQDPNAPPPKPGEEVKENPEEEIKTEADAKEEKPDPKEKEEKKTFGKIYNLPPGNYHKKVNFKALETKLKDYDQSVMEDSKKVIHKMIGDLFDQIERKKIVQGQNFDRMETLQLKFKKELKQILKSSFIQLYKDAKSQASNEILKGSYAKPIANDKFLEMVEAETFRFVGDYEYTILKAVKNELVSAIKDGKSLANVQDILDEEMQELSEVQIERYARTKHTEVMNNARVDFFQESGVVAAYQYSAVLDAATSDICNGLDGKVFAAGTEPVPPMHFNCRSLLIPITKYEEFKVSESVLVNAEGSPVTRAGKDTEEMDINSFMDLNKGKGFATK